MKTPKLFQFSAIICLLAAGCQSTLFESRFGQKTSSFRSKWQNMISGNAREPVSNFDNFAQNQQPAMNRMEVDNQGQIQRVSAEAPGNASLLLSQGHTAFDQARRLDQQKRPREAQRYYNQARSAYEQLLQSNPRNAVAHHRLGIIGDNQEDFLYAERHYLLAIQNTPSGDTSLFNNLGYSYLMQGRLKDSEYYLNQALKIDQFDRKAINNMGLLLASRRDYQGSLEMFRKVGTEAEAQAKVAKLFKNGPPANTNANPNPKNINEVMAEMARKRAEGQQQRALNNSHDNRIGVTNREPPRGSLPAGNSWDRGKALADVRVPDRRLDPAMDNIDQTGVGDQRYRSDSVPPRSIDYRSAGPNQIGVPPRASSNQWQNQDSRAQLFNPPENTNTSLPNVFPMKNGRPPAGTSTPSQFIGNLNTIGTRSPMTDMQPTQQPVQDPWAPANPNPISSRTPNEATLRAARLGMDAGPGQFFRMSQAATQTSSASPAHGKTLQQHANDLKVRYESLRSSTMPSSHQPIGNAVQSTQPRDLQHTQLPNTQFHNTQLPNTQFPNNQIPNTQFQNNQIPNNQIPNTQFPNNQIPNTQLPNTQFSNPQGQDQRLPNTQFQNGQFSNTQIPKSQTSSPQNLGVEAPSTQFPNSQIPNAGSSAIQFPNTQFQRSALPNSQQAPPTRFPTSQIPNSQIPTTQFTNDPFSTGQIQQNSSHRFNVSQDGQLPNGQLGSPFQNNGPVSGGQAGFSGV